MSKCEHDTSETIVKVTTDGIAVHLCTWDCQRHFVTYADENGITHELNQDENAALRAELDAALAQNEQLLEALCHIKDDGCDNFDDPGDCYTYHEYPCPACIALAALNSSQEDEE